MEKRNFYNINDVKQINKSIDDFINIKKKKQNEIISAEKQLWINIFNQILKERGIKRDFIKIGYKYKKYITIESCKYILKANNPLDFANRIYRLGISTKSPKCDLPYSLRQELKEEFIKRFNEMFEVIH